MGHLMHLWTFVCLKGLLLISTKHPDALNQRKPLRFWMQRWWGGFSVKMFPFGSHLGLKLNKLTMTLSWMLIFSLFLSCGLVLGLISWHLCLKSFKTWLYKPFCLVLRFPIQCVFWIFMKFDYGIRQFSLNLCNCTLVFQTGWFSPKAHIVMDYATMIHISTFITRSLKKRLIIFSLCWIFMKFGYGIRQFTFITEKSKKRLMRQDTRGKR